MSARLGQPMTVRALDRVSGLPPGIGLITFVVGHWMAVVSGFAGLGMVRTAAIVTGLLGLVVFLVTAD